MYANARRGAGAGLAIVVGLLTVSPAGAQIAPAPSRKSSVADYPPALPQREGPAPPRVQLALAGEIEVPGPLGWATLTVRDGRLFLTTRAASLSASPEPGSSAEAFAEPALPPAEPEAAWVVAADGRYRFRTVPQGRILAEKRSRHGKRAWKRAWTLRLAASTPSPPIVVGRRVCWAGLDAQVVCVRADNGHRLWAVDVGDRVSRPLSVWRGTMPFAPRKGKPESLRTVEVLLVVPDSGQSLIAMDAYDGARVATLNLPPERGRFASAAVMVSETRVAVARQGYVPAEAAMSLIDLSLPEARPGPDTAPIPYNDAPSSPDPPARR